MIDLRCGDCNIEMQNIESHSVDLVLTDPPYNLGLFMQKRETNLQAMRDNYFGGAGWDNMDFEEWKQCMDLYFKELSRIVKSGSAVIRQSTNVQLQGGNCKNCDDIKTGSVDDKSIGLFLL